MAITTANITKSDEVCGGDACIQGTRIPVWVLVNFRRLGATEAEILEAYPSLKSPDLQAAWEYAASNAEEMDRAIRENEEGDEGFVE